MYKLTQISLKRGFEALQQGSSTAFVQGHTFKYLKKTPIYLDLISLYLFNIFTYKINVIYQ